MTADRPAKMNAAELRRYRAASRQQMISWLNGRPFHSPVTDECCPDFSCCYPDMLMSQEERNAYCLKHLGGPLS